MESMGRFIVTIVVVNVILCYNILTKKDSLWENRGSPSRDFLRNEITRGS